MSKNKYRNKITLSSEICCKSGWAKNYKAEKRTYLNTESNWKNNEDKKSTNEKNADLLRYSREGNLKMVKIAIQNGAEINTKGIDGNNCLILAAQSSGCKELIAYLCEIGRENGLDFNCLNDEGNSALHILVRKNDFKSIANVVLSGADVNLKGKYAQSPIFETVIKREITDDEVQTINLLYKLGADINTKNREGKTPLMDCCHSRERYRGLTKIIELAIEDGSLDEIINAQDKKGTPPISYAIKAGNGAGCDFLVRHNPDLNLANFEGITPLMFAAKTGYKQALRAMLAKNTLTAKYKVDVFAKDERGGTALNYAQMFNNPTCIEILTKAEKYTKIHNEIQGALEEAKEKDDKTEVNRLLKEEKIYGDLSFFGKQNRVEFSFAK